MKSLLHHLALFAACLPLPLAATTLTDTQGRSIEVEILELTEDAVDVRRADGYAFTIPLANLSEASRALLREAEEAGEAPGADYDFNALNELLEIPLWADSDLWDDDSASVAKRLGWPLESQTETQASYRKYFKGKRSPIAGARPHTAVLYTKDGKVDYLSIMFANKGDSVGVREIEDERDALKQVNEAIDADFEMIRTRFDTIAESQNETGGISRGMKERAQRWDYGNNSLWLASVEDEYIALRIMPPDLADRWGQPEYQSDETVRQAAKANVSETDFGDVLIRNIPMVDQGPKGYCVPATMERYLRYMGIRADMYTLAMAGSTTIGGGTSLSAIIDGTSSYVRRSSRKMDSIDAEVDIRTVSKYIDAGQPLMWTMFSTDAYNALANTITKQRSRATDHREWRSELRRLLRDVPELQKDYSSAHLCMIVGYNAETDEIAVSDSWGPRFELRWITAEAANQISQGRFYIIDF